MINFGVYLVIPVYVISAGLPLNVDRSKIEFKLEEFLRNEFDYDSYLNDRSAIPTIPFRDVNTDTFWKFESIEKKKFRKYIESELPRELRSLSTKPWLPSEQILDELARCVHYEYGTMNKQHIVYDKDLYGWMHIAKFSCVLVEDKYIFGMFLARFRFRLKEVLLRKQYKSWASNSRSITIRDMQKMIENFWGIFASKSSSCVRRELKKLNFADGSDEEENYEEGESGEKLSDALLLADDSTSDIAAYSIPDGAKTATENVFPVSDIIELSQNVKREQFFRNISIPITIRFLRLKAKEIPDVVDIYWKDLSPESQSSLESCYGQLCEEADQVSQLTEFNGSKPSEFFKDRALRYNVSPEDVILTYASSRPSFLSDNDPRDKPTKFRKLKKLLATETETEWYKLLDWQVSHNFHANIPEVFREMKGNVIS